MSESFAFNCPGCGTSLESLPGFLPDHDRRPYCGPDCAGVATHGNDANGEPPVLMLHVTEHSDGMIEVGELDVNRTLLTDTIVDLSDAR